MNNDFYHDLKTALTEALAIAKGEVAPAQTFSHEVEISDKKVMNKNAIGATACIEPLTNSKSPRQFANFILQ